VFAPAVLALALAGCTDAELVRHVEHHVVRTAIVCDGTVVRRARLVRGQGREITDVAAAGGRVAWGEIRRDGSRWTGRVTAGRRARDVIHSRRRPRLQVVLTSRGDVAWLAGERVVAWRRGGSLRAIARHDVTQLALEDDRTLRWRTYEDFVPRFRDLRPWPRGRCPQRARFRTVAENADVVVTLGQYGSEYPVDIVRACVRGRSRDHIVATGYDDVGNGESVSARAVYGHWVVIATSTYDRYNGCSQTLVEAIVVPGLYRGRSGVFAGCAAADMPPPSLVVTDGGAVAWITRDATRSALITGGGTSLITLDAGSPNAITGLKVDGRSVRWLHDGEPRAADLG
jgi:hypothetical protein